MATPNEFWLYFHQLAQAYHAEGHTSQARIASLLVQFSSLPPLVRRQLLDDYQLVAEGMAGLESFTLKAAKDEEAEASSSGHVG